MKLLLLLCVLGFCVMANSIPFQKSRVQPYEDNSRNSEPGPPILQRPLHVPFDKCKPSTAMDCEIEKEYLFCIDNGDDGEIIGRAESLESYMKQMLENRKAIAEKESLEEADKKTGKYEQIDDRFENADDGKALGRSESEEKADNSVKRAFIEWSTKISELEAAKEEKIAKFCDEIHEGEINAFLWLNKMGIKLDELSHLDDVYDTMLTSYDPTDYGNKLKRSAEFSSSEENELRKDTRRINKNVKTGNYLPTLKGRHEYSGYYDDDEGDRDYDYSYDYNNDDDLGDRDYDYSYDYNNDDDLGDRDYDYSYDYNNDDDLGDRDYDYSYDYNNDDDLGDRDYDYSYDYNNYDNQKFTKRSAENYVGTASDESDNEFPDTSDNKLWDYEFELGDIDFKLDDVDFKLEDFDLSALGFLSWMDSMKITLNYARKYKRDVLEQMQFGSRGQCIDRVKEMLKPKHTYLPLPEPHN